MAIVGGLVVCAVPAPRLLLRFLTFGLRVDLLDFVVLIGFPDDGGGGGGIAVSFWEMELTSSAAYLDGRNNGVASMSSSSSCTIVGVDVARAKESTS